MSKIYKISIDCREYDSVHRKLFKINSCQPHPIDVLFNSNFKLIKLEDILNYDILNNCGFYIDSVDYNFNTSNPKFGEAIYIIDLEHMNCKKLESKIRKLKLNQIING